ncbi:hypothetical protein FNH22_28720 [Fulvivirga sp. M361]|uniref:hypothetical protein n=1 Tax=Fulvivirga sp. M361 TaxID=2594266 RepID=UPI001179D0DD|nr:hypothetical protein [Fulvivirga sp. M361]TRX48581.1 hypothetical protein FNH22_28720 [Fulvivirga sp. M361]
MKANLHLQIFKHISMAMVLLLIPLFFIACGDDDGDDVLPPKPRVSFTNGSTATVERGQSVEIAIEITAEGGVKGLTVNDADQTFTVDAADATKATATYTFEAGDTEAVGDQILSFEATDNRDQTGTGEFTVTVVGQNISLAADITEDLTLDPDNSYTIEDTIKVSGATLTIPAGLTIKFKVFEKSGDAFTRVAGLDVNNDANIVVEGTAANPVIFTPDSDSPEPGMWSGIRINQEEAVAKPGADKLSYVRVEYAGTDEEELTASRPAVRLNGTDETAILEYIQIFKPLDAGFRLDGSEVTMKYIMVTNAGSSSYLVRNGSILRGQFIIANSPSSDHGDRDLRTRDEGSVAILSNFTFLGSGMDAGTSLDGMRLDAEDGQYYNLYNGIVANYPDDGIRGRSYTAGLDSIAHTYVFQIGGSGNPDSEGIEELNWSQALREGAVNFYNMHGNQVDPDNTLIAGIGVDDFVPDAEESSALDPSSLITGFTAATYVGAIGATDWTLGWTLNVDGSTR